VTEHTRTNCAVIERFLPVRYDISKVPGAATITARPAG